MKKWYVLYVKFQHERKINSILKYNNIETFFPTYKENKQQRLQQKNIERPLFPSYIFVNLESKKDLHFCLSVKNVFCCLKTGNKYSTIRSSEIRLMKELISSDKIEKLSVVGNKINVGEKRIITDGPLSGIECIVQNNKNKNKIIVKIESLNKSIIATIASLYLDRFSKKVSKHTA